MNKAELSVSLNSFDAPDRKSVVSLYRVNSSIRANGFNRQNLVRVFFSVGFVLADIAKLVFRFPGFWL